VKKIGLLLLVTVLFYSCDLLNDFFGEEPTDHLVFFDSQEATVDAVPAIITVASTASTVGSLPTPPRKTGYFFDGWFTEIEGGGEEFLATTIVSEDIRVYAKWVDVEEIIMALTLAQSPIFSEAVLDNYASSPYTNTEATISLSFGAEGRVVATYSDYSLDGEPVNGTWTTTGTGLPEPLVATLDMEIGTGSSMLEILGDWTVNGTSYDTVTVTGTFTIGGQPFGTDLLVASYAEFFFGDSSTPIDDLTAEEVVNALTLAMSPLQIEAASDDYMSSPYTNAGATISMSYGPEGSVGTFSDYTLNDVPVNGTWTTTGSGLPSPFTISVDIAIGADPSLIEVIGDLTINGTTSETLTVTGTFTVDGQSMNMDYFVSLYANFFFPGTPSTDFLFVELSGFSEDYNGVEVMALLYNIGEDPVSANPIAFATLTLDTDGNASGSLSVPPPATEMAAGSYNLYLLLDYNGDENYTPGSGDAIVIEVITVTGDSPVTVSKGPSDMPML
jgi:uncharacterized repeat protein (TIGR02543 family)